MKFGIWVMVGGVILAFVDWYMPAIACMIVGFIVYLLLLYYIFLVFIKEGEAR